MLESLRVLIRATPEHDSVERAPTEVVAHRRAAGVAGILVPLRNVQILFHAHYRPMFDIQKELAERCVDLHGCDLVVEYRRLRFLS